MGVNKFIYRGVTKFDISGDTVDAAHLATGYTAHGADGELITGTGTIAAPQIVLLGSKELTDSYSSTTAAAVTTLTLGSSAFTSDGIVYVKVRDKAGKRNGYFYGTDVFMFNRYPAQGSTTSFNNSANSAGGLTITHRISSNGTYASYSVYNGYGVYGYSVASDGTLGVAHRYNSTYSLTINGTYVIEAYLLTGPFATWYPATT